MSLGTFRSMTDNGTQSNLSIKTRITEVALKSIWTNVESIASSVGFQIDKGDGLVREWKHNITLVGQFMKY